MVGIFRHREEGRIPQNAGSFLLNDLAYCSITGEDNTI